MARPIISYLCGLAALALFGACGGVSEPGLFSPSGDGSGLAGNSSQAGASSRGGGPATPAGGAVGASASGGLGTGGEAESDGGSSGDGGSSSAGATQAGGSGGIDSAAGSAGSVAGSAGAGAGSGGAGSGGAAGGGGGELTCTKLFAQATKQLEAAQTCSLAANAMQCTGEVNNLCGCEVPVQRDNSAETQAYLATLKQIEKQKCTQVCPAIACFPVSFARCKANSPGSTGGTCVSGFASQFP